VSELTVDVKGATTHRLDIEGLSTTGSVEPTYADVLRELELSPHEVTVLVGGRPVPEDQPVDTDHLTVLRLIKGG